MGVFRFSVPTVRCTCGHSLMSHLGPMTVKGADGVPCWAHRCACPGYVRDPEEVDRLRKQAKDEAELFKVNSTRAYQSVVHGLEPLRPGDRPRYGIDPSMVEVEPGTEVR